VSCPTRTTAELLHDGRDATPTPDPTRPDAGATRDHGVHAVEARHERAQADGRDRRERAVRATTDIRSEYGIFPTGSLQTKRPRRETRETESESAPLSGLMSVVVRHGRGACERERESERSSERERDQRGNHRVGVGSWEGRNFYQIRPASEVCNFYKIRPEIWDQLLHFEARFQFFSAAFGGRFGVKFSTCQARFGSCPGRRNSCSRAQCRHKNK
jgi:hypothetical protein